VRSGEEWRGEERSGVEWSGREEDEWYNNRIGKENE
jgi:hypothetical protein